MKNLKLKSLQSSPFMLVMLFMFATISVAAQAATPPPPANSGVRFMEVIPNLTETQRDQIVKLHTAMLKEILPIQNMIEEKEVHLKILTTAEKVDQKAIDKTIDEISDLRSQIQKKRMKFMMDVRGLLTDEQRVVFDQHRMRMMKGHRGQGFGNGQGPGKGQCDSSCRGRGQGRGFGPR